ncbi:hypothetical protein P171DRAFT_432340 [Karstenula rhodostoma CBS 690.94]|uniref:Uncharacterized protein n=1 Tax=Karstenula rhodostoma CBS 690.94 TaxID=1392251 RepID=A0A9P4PFU5_9PLEO|nr:hypothetical protein P171DRAFT_432340 [Karstenula rhodostoma CBS 690.94]
MEPHHSPARQIEQSSHMSAELRAEGSIYWADDWNGICGAEYAQLRNDGTVASTYTTEYLRRLKNYDVLRASSCAKLTATDRNSYPTSLRWAHPVPFMSWGNSSGSQYYEAVGQSTYAPHPGAPPRGIQTSVIPLSFDCSDGHEDVRSGDPSNINLSREGEHRRYRLTILYLNSKRFSLYPVFMFP